jgi:hypothetical protein
MNITSLLLKTYRKKPAEIGKFNVSGIYGLLKGYTSLEQYLKGEQISFKSALQMANGVAKHRLIQDLFKDEVGWEIEKKIEYKPPEYEWTIIGKADLIKDDTLYEIKTSKDLMFEAKPWAEYQVKIYLTLFEKPEGIIVQPIIKKNGLYLKEIGRIKRDDEFVQGEFKKLNDFYKQLKKLA